MNIWIITTGSSDVQLTKNDYWHDWYYDGSPVKRNCENLEFKPTQILEDSDEPYRIAPRVLGKVYESQREEVWQYLEFPLLHQFTTQLQGNKLTKIYLLVTDQTEKYNEERGDIRCPYWQDTCELQPIFERYFKEQEEFRDVELIPIYLSPEQNKPGLDDWNHVLEIVRTAFSEEIKVEPDRVYVSHQAGTPAISSAVQFMSLARFGERVEFLVSNEYEKKPLNPIKSSEYLKGIQVQQVKGLIKSGTPGAALQLLKLEGIKVEDDKALADLEQLVDFFNLNRSLADGSSEFDIEPATQRIIDGLALIEKLFEQENYLQGIALLAAAQETFLKCAIKNEIKGQQVSLSIHGVSQVFQADDLIKWTDSGLKIIPDNALKRLWSVDDNQEIKELKLATLRELDFPVDDQRFKNPNKIDSNEFLLKWLCQLRTDFQHWALLKWSCIDKNINREYEDDIRNQLMHNLQGVKKEEVVKYLLGNQASPNTEVIEAYNAHVKPQFIEGISLCGLPFNKQKLADRLQAVADSISVKYS